MRTFPSWVGLAALALTGCGSAAAETPAATDTTARATTPSEVVDAAVTLESIARADGVAMHARAVLLATNGDAVATIDLGEVAEDPSTCVATEAPSIAEEALSMTFACGLAGAGYQISLVDRHDHVTVWVFLPDDGAGNWERMGDLVVPANTGVRLSGELMTQGPLLHAR